MRNPERIDEILITIARIWKERPELRLCQLLESCYPGKHCLFYVEDDDLKARLRDRYLKEEVSKEEYYPFLED
jgi:hypothetical protein